MKVRQDAWSEENDLLLAETVLRHVREGSTQLNAFEEVGDKLNRTSAACGFRWNAVVRHRYEKALQLAKKQRKQRNRLLGKEQGGKKKLLYNPPVPAVEEVELLTADTLPMPEETEVYTETYTEIDIDADGDAEEETIEAPEPVFSYPAYQPAPQPRSQLNLDSVISYLQSLNGSTLSADLLKSENERLRREIAMLRSQNEELSGKIGMLEQNTVTIQEDYETLMKIMNRARKLVLFDEEERPATKFKMDRNGNLEKVAE
ncbi:RsfA family transcriptional regulator [Bacillus infantis]|uniref:RsfA family transcriptional regulator n=1 Tax=Bacillus infantis TaxID=324767 RepID=UPI003CEDF1C2